jgi:CdiI immunity protein
VHPHLTRPLDESPLIQLLLTYFDEDWTLDDPSESAVVSRFLSQATPTDISAVIGDLDEVLDGWSDQGIRDLAQRHMANIDLGERTSRAWLVWLGADLSAGASDGALE